VDRALSDSPEHPRVEHPNVVRVRELFAAFERRELPAILALVPEGVVWHFPGRRGALAGTHVGREAVLRFLGDVARLTDGTFHLELEDVIANDHTAVAFFRGRGRRGERTLDNPTCLKLRLEDGSIAEIWEFVWDLEHVEDFWS
jgi:ketosteroid isomerase-like protein